VFLKNLKRVYNLVMVKGIGIDIVSIRRIEKMFDMYGEKFVERVLSSHEKEKLNKESKR